MAYHQERRRELNVFRSAIADKDGNVDAGYLSMFWGLVGWSANNGAIIMIASYAIFHAETGHVGDVIQNMGIAFGANAGGFATLLGAVGLFRMGDKERQNVGVRDNGSSPLPQRGVQRSEGDGVERRSGETGGSQGAGDCAAGGRQADG